MREQSEPAPDAPPEDVPVFETMTESFQILATLLAAQVVLNLSPGPNMMLVAHAASRSRAHGFAVAAGIWPVGIAWAVLGLTGLGAAFTALPGLAEAMRIVCGLYLGWLGIQSVRRSFAEPGLATPGPATMSLGEGFRAGVLSNVTNPKAIAYYMSIFAATGAQALAPAEQVLAVVMMPTLSFLWNLGLAATVASPPVARILDGGRSWLDRLAGGVMLLFGLKLVFGRD